MIQINCTTINLKTAPILVTETGHSYTAILESSTRAIFKLVDTDANMLGDFFERDELIYANFIIPPVPGAFEGPVLESKSNVKELHIVEDQFLLPDGNNYNWAGHIDWMLYKRSLDGIEIEPLLEQRYNAGSRSVATLMEAHFIEKFYPSEYGERYYDHIPAFASALKDAGFYWQPVCYADEQVVKSGKEFVYRLAEMFRDRYWILPSLGNEWPKNGFYPGDFSRPNTNNLWSRGSSVGDEAPFYPSWDWKEWHPRRDWPKVLFGNDDAWYVKEGVNGDLQRIDPTGRRPCVATEPIGFWDHDVPNRRSNDPNLARVIGGTSSYFARGANFMSEQGLRCEFWDPITFRCAVEFFAGINQKALTD